MNQEALETLQKILLLNPEDLTQTQKEFLIARRSYLNNEQRRIFASVLNGTVAPAPEAPKEPQTPAAPEAPVTPTQYSNVNEPAAPQTPAAPEALDAAQEANPFAGTQNADPDETDTTA